MSIEDNVHVHRLSEPNSSSHRPPFHFQVKGRRYCQPRLMEPTAKSVNSGDAYVLVTPTEVFNWVGRFSNVIERNRSVRVQGEPSVPLLYIADTDSTW